MAVGAQAKKEITEKILKTFDGSFLYNDGKEIRIPFIEDGAPHQIKCTLTCAKVNAETVPVEVEAPVSEDFMNQPAAPTEEEKDAVARLIERLGLNESHN